MENKAAAEYYALTEKLEELDWALEGECNDIDCDKYMYKELLKKKYRPVLEHNFSCMKKIRDEKEAFMRILSQRKYINYRYIKCPVCRKRTDKLSQKSTIVSFTKKSLDGKRGCEWHGVWTHRSCASKVKIPDGWKKFR